MEDVERLTSREGSWTLTILVSSGAQEPSYPTAFHYSAGGAKGDESFEGDNLVVKDMVAYRAFYEDASAQIKEKFLCLKNCAPKQWNHIKKASEF